MSSSPSSTPASGGWMAALMDLPDAALHHVLRFFPAAALCAVCCVCRRGRVAGRRPGLWRSLCARGPRLRCQTGPHTGLDWIAVYRALGASNGPPWALRGAEDVTAAVALVCAVGQGAPTLRVALEWTTLESPHEAATGTFVHAGTKFHVALRLRDGDGAGAVWEWRLYHSALGRVARAHHSGRVRVGAMVRDCGFVGPWTTDWASGMTRTGRVSDGTLEGCGMPLSVAGEPVMAVLCLDIRTRWPFVGAR